MNSTAGNNTNASEFQRIFTLVIYFLTFFVGLTGNLVVVVIISRRKKKKTMNDFFVVNLCVSDLCLIVFCLPALIYVQLIGYVGSLFYCKFVWPMVTVSYCSSIFTITSMACYRCKVLLHPLELPPSRKFFLFWISSIWFLSFATALPLIIVSEFREHFKGSSCYEDWPSPNYKQGYTVALFLLQYLLPFVIIAVAYIRIGIDLTRTKVRRASVTSRGNVSARGTREDNIKIIKILATIVILFAICMLPVHLAWMWQDFGGKRGAEIAPVIFKFSDILAIFHSCLNAVIYGALTKHLRQVFANCFFRLLIYLGIRKKRIRRPMERRQTYEMMTFETSGGRKTT
ncbi:neuropeptide FF receptor 2-like [Montipora capricornis]|uniref:neuropeptide FF receptor 2-like n=1 Tax=Montipora capricornis TaxID=246305 RepID=UPI0035F1FC62